MNFFEGVSAPAVVGDEAADVRAVLDATEMDEELVAFDNVTELEVAGTALEPEVDEDAVLEIAAGDCSSSTCHGSGRSDCRCRC